MKSWKCPSCNRESETEDDVVIKCKQPICKFLAKENLIINYCENCKKKYPRGTKYCDVCKPYTKGKFVGQKRILKERLNDKDSCQVYRGLFKKMNGR